MNDVIVGVEGSTSTVVEKEGTRNSSNSPPTKPKKLHEKTYPVHCQRIVKVRSYLTWKEIILYVMILPRITRPPN